MKLKKLKNAQKQIEQDDTVDNEIKSEMKQHKKSIKLSIGTICVATMGLGLCSLPLTTEMKEIFLTMDKVVVVAIKAFEVLAATICTTGIIHSIKTCRKEKMELTDIVRQVSNDKKKKKFIKREDQNAFQR